jgi:pyridoxamine 5'-phosphate oxidase
MSENINLAAIRKNYALQELTEDSVLANPLDQFNQWLLEAIQAQAEEPTAMVLSTVSAAGRPGARVVLLKGLENGQFVFFTNYNSRKGREIAAHDQVALTFFWPVLERQVRIEGKVMPVATSVSDAYFSSRPRGSQVGAWVSPQSQPIKNRQDLEAATAQYINQVGEVNPILRPPHWGGFGVVPDYIEFWQGRPNRLHDRLAFSLSNGTASWSLNRLAP